MANVKTLPGAASAPHLQDAETYLARAYRPFLPAMIAKAEGSLLFDLDGNRYIDFVGGVGCLNVGHSHPKVVAAVVEQAKRFTHTDYTMFPYAPLIELAKRLAPKTRIPNAKGLFFNSGAEAVENAVKIARWATGRPGVIAFDGAFHGRTYMAMSLTSKLHPYKAHYGPYAPEVYRLPYPSATHGPRLDEFRRFLDRAAVTWFDPAQIACVIAEPIQGEGGYIVPVEGFFPLLREFCDKHGILLIADEIQTGYGRTGRFFAMEHEGVVPDLMTCGKSIAAGLPLSAVFGRAEIMDAPAENTLGGTYVGNPVAASAGLAVLDAMEEEGLVARAEEVGARIRAKLLELMRECRYIGDVRGRGAMLAVEFVRDRATMAPYPEMVARVLRLAMERGLLLMKCGVYNNAIRFLCPLNIPWDVLDEGLEIFAAVVREAKEREAHASV